MKECEELDGNIFNSGCFLTFSLGLLLICLSAFLHLSSTVVFADGDTVIDVINATVPVACSVDSPSTDQTYTAAMRNNQYKNDIGSTSFNVVCNDTAGFAIYAIGYGNNTLGVTDMVSSVNTNYNIVTGTAESGNTSNWAMKLAAVSGDDAPTITNSFQNFHAVPPTWTRVAEFTRAVGASVGSSFTSTYAVWVSGTQQAGTYTGKVRYTLIHPNTSCMSYTVHFNANTGSGSMDDQVICAGASVALSANTFTPPTGYEFLEWNTNPSGTGTSYDDEESVTDIATAGSTVDLYAIWYRPPINLYNEVASKTKGTQTLSNLQSTISTSNSGVYTYNSSVFGTDTDGTKSDNTKATIYYYRGILDSSFGSSTYGSSGDGALSPNYVILSTTGTKATSDTCWRIIRTTGSGGVKMIYNGKWTGSTCANAQNNARIGASAYNTASGSYPVRRIALAGYTYNNTYGTSTSTTAVSTDLLFGSNSNYSSNTTNSTIKGNVDSWYNSNLSTYTSILEPNAGFCNDRTTYSNTAGSTTVTSLRPYANNNNTGNTAYFGAYSRNGYNSSTRVPSLACPSNRNVVDIYSTSTSSGGNGQLSVPIALITADELSFAGAGSQTANQGSAYTPSSFVRSGNSFWTMSPNSRTNRNTATYYSNASGYLSTGTITTTTYDIRPVISLKEGTLAVEGTGTAADPWVVPAP